jgi:hypothetical protein
VPRLTIGLLAGVLCSNLAAQTPPARAYNVEEAPPNRIMVQVVLPALIAAAGTR